MDSFFLVTTVRLIGKGCTITVWMQGMWIQQQVLGVEGVNNEITFIC